jgi:hypothetical protein
MVTWRARGSVRSDQDLGQGKRAKALPSLPEDCCLGVCGFSSHLLSRPVSQRMHHRHTTLVCTYCTLYVCAPSRPSLVEDAGAVAQAAGPWSLPALGCEDDRIRQHGALHQAPSPAGNPKRVAPRSARMFSQKGPSVSERRSASCARCKCPASNSPKVRGRHGGSCVERGSKRGKTRTIAGQGRTVVVFRRVAGANCVVVDTISGIGPCCPSSTGAHSRCPARREHPPPTWSSLHSLLQSVR